MALDPITGAMELVGTIGGWVNDSFKAKRELAAAEAENKARLLRDAQTNNAAWEMANLTDKDQGLRRVCFGIFIFPFFWSVFDPAGVTNYFQVVLTAMPEWYVQIVIAMVGGIWGISALKNVVPSVIGQTISILRK
ncbi:protein of unknown function [Magnetospirillum sp. XM-1]|uniref:hypothetical protein n=1 Tax=Magnetospirillum sp. XM-1 TaxID=1663591 RepID=UPI00073DC885|nr:hypothetical protein [Magnetospirillum sp. XM-1]CUW38798.1 protein of unknown function [Magnetospirillum sp. XM-1]